MAFAPDGRLFVNDVGQGTWEEIDDGEAGADYGWNVREGHCAPARRQLRAAARRDDEPDPRLRPRRLPVDHRRRVRPRRRLAGEYRGDYLFADFVCGKIFRLEPRAGGATRDDFATGLGASSAVHLEFGPDDRRSTTRPTPAAARSARSPSIPAAAAVETFVSDLTPVSATNGYGPVERDLSNGGVGRRRRPDDPLNG